ncbi:hypothetical protein B296_00039324 [Ensete ventricosum]|uniref:Uncharacterized protein n=1 Tax=Ensete ventricosum TaxID=4639 RepID=A0A426XYV1_ENSVE|nr:hypothetical protein B296_00039324 [Ensete ventricosum]
MVAAPRFVAMPTMVLRGSVVKFFSRQFLWQRRTVGSRGYWRFICCWFRSGSHPSSVLVEPLLLDSSDGNYDHHGATLPRFNFSFYFRLESFDECP